MDGFTVAAELIKRYEKPSRPLICALTANSDTKTREHCFEVGMDYVLMKPISLPLLKTELAKLVELREECTPPQLAEKPSPLAAGLLDKRASTSTAKWWPTQYSLCTISVLLYPKTWYWVPKEKLHTTCDPKWCYTKQVLSEVFGVYDILHLFWTIEVIEELFLETKEWLTSVNKKLWYLWKGEATWNT